MLRLCRFLFQIISAITWYHSDFPPVSWLGMLCSSLAPLPLLLLLLATNNQGELSSAQFSSAPEDQITNKVVGITIIGGIPQTAIYLILSIGLISVFVPFLAFKPFSFFVSDWGGGGVVWPDLQGFKNKKIYGLRVVCWSEVAEILSLRNSNKYRAFLQIPS